MVNWIRFAARTLSSAVGGSNPRLKSRRKMVSKFATPRVFASTAAGNKIHSALLSDGRKLIPGSHRQNHVRPVTTATPKIAASNIKTALKVFGKAGASPSAHANDI